MSVTIPIGLPSDLPPLSGGVQIPVFGGPSGGLVERERQVLRAVAAAAAIAKPADALELAGQAQDDPGAIAAIDIDETKLAPALASVAAALTTTPATPPKPSAPQVAAARAVGVEPALVAVASAQLEENDAATDALAWVAAIEAELLDNAARAGLRRERLGLVPTANQERPGLVPTADQGSRLDEVEARLKTIESRLTQQPGPAQQHGSEQPARPSTSGSEGASPASGDPNPNE